MLLEPLRACYTRYAKPLYIIIHPLILMLAAKIGLLPKDSMEMASSAYQHFRSTGPENKILAEVFKEMHCRDVPVDFIGVW
jgi:hypothetical protein